METKPTPEKDALDLDLEIALDFIQREYEAYEGGQDIRAAAAAVRRLHAAAAGRPTEVLLRAVLAYPGSKVSDLLVGGHRVQIPNEALEAARLTGAVK